MKKFLTFLGVSVLVWYLVPHGDLVCYAALGAMVCRIVK